MASAIEERPPAGSNRNMIVNRRAVFGICFGLCLTVFFFGLIVLVRDNLLAQPISKEDTNWLRGGRFWYESRLSSTFIFRQICLPLFGDRLVGYKLPSALFHLGNALLIYALFSLLLGHLFGRRKVGKVRFGAFMASVTFLSTPTSQNTVQYFSALAYILVATAILVGLILAVKYLRSRRPLYWLGLFTCYQAALLSHSFALGLPLFVLIMEVLLFRPRNQPRHLLRDLALRYGPLAAMGAFRAWQLWKTELNSRLDETLTRISGMSLYRSVPLYYVEHLRELVPTDPALSLATTPVLVAFTLLATVAGATAFHRRVRSHERSGGIEMFVVWLLAWLGMTFPHLLWIAVNPARSVLEHTKWRLYLNQVGIAIFAAYLMVRALDLLDRGRVVRGELWGAAMCTALAAVLLLNGNGKLLHRFPDTIEPLRAALNERVCRSHLRCASAGAGAGMSCRDLRGANLKRANLIDKDLRGSQLIGANLVSAHAAGVDAREACFAFSLCSKLNLAGALLAGANFRGADLGGANLRGARASGAIFTDAELDKADLSMGHFAGAVMLMANMNKAIMRGADLRGADLRGADLRGADLRGADLRGAKNLSHANLEGARLEGAKLPHAR